MRRPMRGGFVSFEQPRRSEQQRSTAYGCYVFGSRCPISEKRQHVAIVHNLLLAKAARYEQDIEFPRARFECTCGQDSDPGVRQDHVLRLPHEMSIGEPRKDRLGAEQIQQRQTRVKQHANLERWLSLFHDFRFLAERVLFFTFLLTTLRSL